jgi:hypothetical protein
MNERIKELLKQSGLQPYYDAQEGQIEKFAQLIVEECAQRAEAYAYMSQNFTALAEELRRMKQNG